MILGTVNLFNLLWCARPAKITSTQTYGEKNVPPLIQISLYTNTMTKRLSFSFLSSNNCLTYELKDCMVAQRLATLPYGLTTQVRVPWHFYPLL